MGSDKAKKEIKTSMVVHKDTIIKVGEIIIPAPIGVKIDLKTGEVMAPVEMTALGDIALTPKIEKKLLVNEGFIKLRLLFKDTDPNPCPDIRKDITRIVFVPIQSFHEIDRICPSDNVQEEVKISSITISGFPDTAKLNSAGQKINLIVKVILKVKLTISREEIIPVPLEHK